VSIVPSSRANIRAEPEGPHGTCAFLDDTQGQIENLAAQPAAEGHARYMLKSGA
jgi:hypothetical protein